MHNIMLEQKIQAYLKFKQEIIKEQKLHAEIIALERDLKRTLGDNLKHIHDKL
ncbi:MAG: hypothetical protein ACMXYA_02405 [Candidatus Woesearchaeota archaeon]